MAGLVLRVARSSMGGVEEMEKLNNEKATLLYDYLDESKLFNSPVEKESRSLMNVTFVTGDARSWTRSSSRKRPRPVSST